MRDLYSSDQQTRLMLFGDLLEDPLATAERMALEAALRDANGDVHAALETLSPEAATKARSLLEQGLKLSFELDRLKQRGISVLFLEGTPMGRIGSFFSHEPTLLFAVGNRGFWGTVTLGWPSSLLLSGRRAAAAYSSPTVPSAR